MFSRILYRYIMREYILIWLATLGGLLMVTLVGDAAERMSDFVDAQAPARLIALFYLNQIPYYLIFVLPASSLIATLFTLGQMSRYNELTAMLSSGVSLAKIFRPLLLLMLMVSGLTFVVNETVVPRANENKNEIQEYRIKGRPRPENTVRRGVDYLGEEGRRWVADEFSPADAVFRGVRLLQFEGSTESLSIAWRVDASHAHFRDDSLWVFTDGTVRYFTEGGEELLARFDSLAMPTLREKPEDFMLEVKDAQQMSFTALRDQIAKKRRNGLDVAPDLTEMWFKTSLPAANFIIVLFGAPLAVMRRKTGPGVGIAIGVFVYMLFMISYYLTRTLGYSGLIHPALAAWGSNIIFGVAGVVIFIRVRK